MSAKLAPQYMFALVAALCVAAIFLVYTLVTKPKQDNLTALRDQITSLQTQKDQYARDAAMVPELQKTVAQLEIDRAEFLRALPTTAQFNQVVAQLRANVAAAKADLKDLTFSSGHAGGAGSLPAGVNAINIDMGTSGKYSQLFQVLRSLETQNRFTTVNNVDLQLPAANSFDPKLEGKMGLTVYTYDPSQSPAGTPATPGSAPAAPAAPASGGTQ